MWSQKVGLLFRRKRKILVVFCIIIGVSAFLFFSGIWKVRGLVYLLGKELDSDIRIEVYVWDGEPSVVHSRDRDNPDEIIYTFHVYQATGEQVNALAQIPHTNFYKSKFEPVVCMTIKLRHLIAVTSLPLVQYIQIIPSPTSL